MKGYINSASIKVTVNFTIKMMFKTVIVNKSTIDHNYI